MCEFDCISILDVVYLQCLVLDSILRWGGVVDELDFAKRLQAWYNHGFPELGDSEGYTFCKTIVAVSSCSIHSLPTHKLFLNPPESLNFGLFVIILQ